MPHEVTHEDLSAFLDSELDPETRARVEKHLASCPDCEALLGRLKTASSAFKKHGSAPSPAGLDSRVLDSARGGEERRVPTRRLRYALALAVIVVALLAGSVAFKRFMPQFLTQVQAMIGKAAGSLGQ